MTFDLEKKNALSKIDKSKKGEIDVHILPLIKKINSSHDFYTTSSCSGRIQLIVPGTKKNMAEWVFVSHEKVSLVMIKSHMKVLPNETMWFRMEHPIIHICCRDLEYADNLLKKANEAGFRRSSILGYKKRVIVEIMIPEKMDVPVSMAGKTLVSDEYLKIIIKLANAKLKESHLKLKALKSLF